MNFLIRLLGRFVVNFRMGLATNSSSSHSLVFFHGVRPGHDTSTLYDIDVEFGWEQFRLTTLREKLMYALVAYMQKEGLAHAWTTPNPENLQKAKDQFGDLFPELPADAYEIAAKGYIDHQSIEYGSPEHVLAAARNPYAEIWGGNDNSGDPHEDYLGWGVPEGTPLPGDMVEVKYL